MDNILPEALTLTDYIAGAIALILHFIFKGVIDDDSFIHSLVKNKRYIITSILTTSLGFLGADTLSPMLGFSSYFTFCVTWGAGAGSLFYNIFKIGDNIAIKTSKVQPDENS